jgi:pyrrolidone-carboxylate peptidase
MRDLNNFSEARICCGYFFKISDVVHRRLELVQNNQTLLIGLYARRNIIITNEITFNEG